MKKEKKTSKIFSLFLGAFLFLLPFSQGSEKNSTETLPHTLLSIGASQLEVIIAADAAAREQGLMKQKTWSANKGMLFIFPAPQRVAFWMKDTSLPLSIAYLNAHGRILEIHDLKPFDEHSLLSSSSSIAYAIEVPQGWFNEHKILSGDLVTGLPGLSSAR